MSKTLILLPGLLCDFRLWARQSQALSSRIGVVVPDLARDDSLEAMAERVLAAAPPRFALGGLSMGGYLSLEIMRRAPERVERLALLCTNAQADPPEQKQRRLDAIALAASPEGFDQVVAAQAAALLAPDSAADPAIAGLFRAMASSVGSEGFARQQRAIMARPDSRPGLSAIACPTLILCGALDTLTPPDLHRGLAAAISGARLEIVPDSGHLAPIERPDAVSLALASWLSDL
ncbi:alpha/beta fold hydrolase [Magnetospirillum molischianum]|uniref:Predicted hydrolase or acyltransferase n=1 Tax=Magnetospirillum molischianum DSM 120 TaxID=1150626 RepID=H8FRI1_MAGML|nr:alpha/beta fold hydrolase [Magnetospirillum molischianum]CCG40969.1 Predicted hydrolase or acyltransferase [Magnetospirillum molischianum DSM 120]